MGLLRGGRGSGVTVNLKRDRIEFNLSILTNLKRDSDYFRHTELLAVIADCTYRSRKRERHIARIPVPAHKYLPNDLRQ